MSPVHAQLQQTLLSLSIPISGFGLMGPSLLVLGFCLGFITFPPPLLVAILCALVVPLLWWQWVSLPLKSKLLTIGPLQHGSATFASILCFSSLSSFMVVLFMAPLSPLSHLIPPNSLSTHLNSPIAHTLFRSYPQCIGSLAGIFTQSSLESYLMAIYSFV